MSHERLKPGSSCPIEHDAVSSSQRNDQKCSGLEGGSMISSKWGQNAFLQSQDAEQLSFEIL